MSYVTRYRAFLLLDGVRTPLDGTTERKTKGALLKLIQKNGSVLLSVLSAADLDTKWTYRNGIIRMGSAQFFLEFVPAHTVIR